MIDTDTTDCPFPCTGLHVSRWEGTHTDGEHSQFVRKRNGDGERLVLKKGAKVDRSTLLRETVQFGKHKGSLWGELPKSYLQWLVENGHGKWKKIGRTARWVLEELK